MKYKVSISYYDFEVQDNPHPRTDNVTFEVEGFDLLVPKALLAFARKKLTEGSHITTMTIGEEVIYENPFTTNNKTEYIQKVALIDELADGINSQELKTSLQKLMDIMGYEKTKSLVDKQLNELKGK